MKFMIRQPLAVLDTCETTCRLCSTLGCLRPESLDWDAFLVELDLMERAAPDEIVMPPNALEHFELGSFCAEITRRGMTPVVRLRPHQLVANPVLVQSLDYQGASFEIIFDRPVTHVELDTVERFFNQHSGRIVLVPSPFVDANAVLDALPRKLKRELQILAPLHGENGFSPDEIHDWLSQNRFEERDLSVPLSAGIDQGVGRFWETGVHTQQLFEHGPQTDAVRVSVVIPFHGEPGLLFVTLNSLAKQTLSATQFEIIVVADRRTPNILELVVEQIPKIIFNSHVRVLKIADFSKDQTVFRAGVVRNGGALCANGDILLFLDSDAVAPPELLADALSAHEQADVIQYKRKELSSARPANSYWTHFYNSSDWQKLADRWKFVSSFCLSVKVKHFLEVGGFPSALSRFGCEDTFLGWKLDQLQLRFSIRNLEVTHAGSPLRSYAWSSLRKMRAMRRSAMDFYLCTLDPEVYRVFFTLMGPGPELRWLARAAARTQFTIPILSFARFGLLFLKIRNRKSYLLSLMNSSVGPLVGSMRAVGIRFFMRTTEPIRSNLWFFREPASWLEARFNPNQGIGARALNTLSRTISTYKYLANQVREERRKSRGHDDK